MTHPVQRNGILAPAMHWRKNEEIRTTRRQRISTILFGFILMLPALSVLARRGLFYQDYRGLLVFAPFMLLVGLVMVFFGIRVGKRDQKKKRL